VERTLWNAGRGSAAAKPDVLIVGGGVIGLSLAREIAGRGPRVTLLERARTGQEASWAAAGMLVPRSESAGPGPLFDLMLESHCLYPEWVRRLEGEAGETVGHRVTGLIHCVPEGSEEEMLARFRWQTRIGLPVARWGPGDVARRLGPGASPVRSALFFPDEGVVDPRRLTSALALAARERGVDLRTDTPVRRFRIEGGRCLGVETDSGRVDAGAVVNASGAWAGFDDALPFAVPVEPVRGQIVEIAMGPEAPASILEAEGVYVAPHEGGRVLLGSTLERAGFEKRVTAGAVGRLISEAGRLWPAVAEGRFVTAWAGLRPGTPDGMPILGACGIEGLFFATGHYRHGVLLAPATARRLADVLTGSAAEELAAFSISRFSPEAEIRSGGPKASAPANFK